MKAEIGKYLEDAVCQTIDKAQTTLKEVTAGKPTLFGPLIDIGTHALDITLWCMDNYKPVSVMGSVFEKYFSDQAVQT